MLNKNKNATKKCKNGMKAEKVEVIKTSTTEGKGTEEDPVRTVVRYWEMDGTLIVKQDELFSSEC